MLWVSLKSEAHIYSWLSFFYEMICLHDTLLNWYACTSFNMNILNWTRNNNMLIIALYKASRGFRVCVYKNKDHIRWKWQNSSFKIYKKRPQQMPQGKFCMFGNIRGVRIILSSKIVSYGQHLFIVLHLKLGIDFNYFYFYVRLE